jgi:predicted regulator of amino acid metabolism with ACT domain
LSITKRAADHPCNDKEVENEAIQEQPEVGRKVVAIYNQRIWDDPNVENIEIQSELRHSDPN